MRADDVPPGSYALAIELTSAVADPQQFSKPFGSLKTQVNIPPGDDENAPVDLGILTVERAK